MRFNQEFVNISTEDLAAMYQLVESEAKRDSIFLEIQKRVEGIVVEAAHKYSNLIQTTFQDRLDVGEITLIKILKIFDTSKGYKLSTYFYSALHKDLLDLYRAQSSKKRHQDFIAASYEELKEEGSQDKALALYCEDYREVELKESLKTILNERELMIVSLLLQGKTKSQISKELGLSSISYSMNSLKEKMVKLNS